MLSPLPNIDNMIHFIFDFSVLSDFHRARSNRCLSFKGFFVWVNTRDVDYWMNAHGLGRCSLTALSPTVFVMS
jgi:hypothetical protein